MVQGRDTEHEVVTAHAPDVEKICLPVSDVVPGAFGLGQVDHRTGKVDGVDVREPLSETHRVLAGAAAQVQRPPAAGRQDFRQPLPQVVALKLVQTLVLLSDPVEGLRVGAAGHL